MRSLRTLQLQSDPTSFHSEDCELAHKGITLLFASSSDSSIVFTNSMIAGFSSDKLGLSQVMRTTGVIWISLLARFGWRLVSARISSERFSLIP